MLGKAASPLKDEGFPVTDPAIAKPQCQTA
jgi:hypothetical protein